MDELSLIPESVSIPGFSHPVDIVVPCINDVPLDMYLAWALDSEKDPQFAAPQAPLPVGISREIVAPPSRHWLGAPDPGYRQGDHALVQCSPGAPWDDEGLLALITVEAACVRWSDFSFPLLEEDADVERDQARVPLRIGPFEFDRGQYERELSRLAR